MTKSFICRTHLFMRNTISSARFVQVHQDIIKKKSIYSMMSWFSFEDVPSLVLGIKTSQCPCGFLMGSPGSSRQRKTSPLIPCHITFYIFWFWSICTQQVLVIPSSSDVPSLVLGTKTSSITMSMWVSSGFFKFLPPLKNTCFTAQI